ncbi:ABC transporter substrate-binding protein [Actinomadura mexicana]|uniref:Carbohydrate ABC transporter substrate-binding protein, CUT1 family n=1 Tax=Actinomadura mexicana TaxID=134959 RepID=A0A238XF72_9ACTN|nr:ABC transporter substrate-binding protein [Actinomadura mexicana]SNR57258.1 carbohydrate ABC transporter substrate-binding protein, CUT1 family [Actinomadura mexicana]
MIGNVRRLSVCTAAGLLLTAGCGGAGSDDGAAGTGKIRVVALSLGAPGDQNPMRVAAREFESRNPGTKVEVTMYEFTQFDQVVRAQINGGSPPDVVQTVLGYGNATALKTLAKANVLTDLSDQAWAGSIPEQAKGPSGLDGKIYAYPPMYGLIGAVYNAKTLKDLGVTPPTKYSEVLAYCSTMKSKGKTPIALGAQTPIATVFMSYALAASTAYAERPSFNEDRLTGGATFSGSKGWLRSLEQFSEMNRAGCFGSAPTGVAYQASLQQVATGKAGMVVNVIEGLATLRSMAPKADFRMVALPSGDDAATTRVPAAPSAGFAIPKRAKKAELAKKFVSFMAEDGISTRYAEGVGSVPVAGIGSAGTARFPAGTEAMKGYVATGKSMIYPSQYWPAPEVNAALERGLTGMLSDQTKPAEILKSMDAAWKVS